MVSAITSFGHRPVNFGKVVPLKTPETQKPAQAVRFGNNGLGIYGDSPIDFDQPVTGDTVRQLKKALLEASAARKALGGSVKLLIHSPGGDVSSGSRILDLVSHLKSETPLDTIIDGGQAASMGSILFLMGDRRIMTPSGRLMVHPPMIVLPERTPLKEPDLQDLSKELNRVRTRMDHYIAKRTGLNIDDVQTMTNKDTYIEPLKALQLGFATHLLLNKDDVLTQDSVKGLSDEEIDRRDLTQDYDGLEVSRFDLQGIDPRKFEEIKMRQMQDMMRASRPGGPTGPQGSGFPGGPRSESEFEAPEKATAEGKSDELPSRPRIILMA